MEAACYRAQGRPASGGKHELRQWLDGSWQHKATRRGCDYLLVAEEERLELAANQGRPDSAKTDAQAARESTADRANSCRAGDVVWRWKCRRRINPDIA